VAREFGIPAIVNLPGAMVLLKDGELVRVDGTAGTVTRLDMSASR
jgi:phosphoenolpyruvate-protein kinase (PTS system EI component)